MAELVSFSLSGFVLPFTILFAITLVYFLTVAVGVLDLEFLDFDVDTDLEVNGGVSIQLMSFLNLGQLPFMIIYSILTLCMWVFAVLGNYYLNPLDTWTIGLILIVPNVVGSIVITRVVSIPLVKLFEALNKSATIKDIIGAIGVVVIALSESKLGQIEITVNNASVLINAKNIKESTLRKGSRVLVIEKDTQKDFYLVDEFND